MRNATINLCWILHKDLVTELRSPGAWLAMVLTGIVVAVIFSVQSDLSAASKQQMVGGSLWMAVFLAGIPMMDRAFAAERENGCWQGLKLMPIAPSAIYLAKIAANVVALTLLECLLIPLFLVLSNIKLASGAWLLAAIAMLTNIALSAVGAAVGSLGLGRRGGGAMVVLVLPLAIPVLMAAAECTRLVVGGHVGGGNVNETFWRWIQLLAAFDAVFVTAGVVLFAVAIEE